MPPKVRQRGKKPSKVRKLQQEQEEEHKESVQPVASSSSSSTNHIQLQADYIPLSGDDAPSSTAPHQENGDDGQPNWVKLGDRPSKAEHEAPFGYVDAELKAYLRAGWDRVIELEAQGYAAKSTLTALTAASSAVAQPSSRAADEEDDELALLLQATLKEMDGKELLLSTDPDTSLIVEAILHRLPAKPLRVFVDRLAGNFAVLAKHRFASHVVQACLATLQPAVTLEHAAQEHFQQHTHRANGNGKAAASSAYASDTATIVNEDGILRSATQLILDIAEELASDQQLLTSLVTDAFGSHVLRSLLCVLTGRSIQAEPSSGTAATAGGSDLRSRRSAKFRTRKAPAPGSAAAAGSSDDLLVVIPDLLFSRATTLRKEILNDAGVDVVRRWATDAVASPLLQLLIEVEADSLNSEDASQWKGSLVDSFLNGFVSTPPTGEEAQKDVYLETSLRDSVASHALQLALERAPSSTASRFFDTYIRSRMAKLCVHPAANHIVATLLRRLDGAELQTAIAEMTKVASGMVKEQMVGCLQAAVDRVVQLCAAESEAKDLVQAVSDAVLAAFRIKSQSTEEEGLKLLVPAVLALKTRKAYLHTFGAHLKKEERDADGKGRKRGRDGKAKGGKKKSKSAAEGSDQEEEAPWSMDASYELPTGEATVQGSLLLQSLLRLPGPAAPPRAPAKRTFGRPVPASTPTPAPESWGSALVLDSLLALPTLVPFARNPTAVHVLISSLVPPPSSTTSSAVDYVQSARRRKLSSSLTAALPSYCGDKYGSRLADALWFSVDGFTKEKIVKTVIEHDAEVLKGPYAGYFTNKLQLQLYRKGKVREWNEAVKAQKAPEVKKEEASGERMHKAVVVETKRAKVGKKERGSKVDGELDSILGQI
ncbi:Armadillo-type fold [Kalmanozyma brasiliensis GHG001]|uniref:Nucleolar protein 9 n=1 Tax=Kalmanozyma brasiliensis (strain GHG001) TaxID=1365824 RepID=V5ETA1_KALBG|nr:Armadillo-type fold [Kalmanozyma brasiliensis GHG001]EST05219.1 Armadillo-type fold [Kalmanozyma brasiliensis GHG001]